MSHGEHHMMSDGYRPINETFSQCQVNLQTQFGVAELNVSPMRKKLSSRVLMHLNVNHIP